MNQRGMTLVEVLVGMIITGVIGTAVVSLLVAQSRFYNRTDDQRAAESTAHATFDLFSAEVRGASASDLLAATPDSVRLRFDVVRAVVCAAPNVDETTLYVYERTTNANLTGSFVGIAASGPYDGEFDYADGWNPTPTATGAVPKAACVLSGAPGTGADADYMTIVGWSGNFPGGAPPNASMVRGYSDLTYRIASSSFFASRNALWRGTQEMVGPFDTTTAFSYEMEDGSVVSSVASGDFDEVAGVRFTGTTLGEGANRFGVERDIDFTVPFRN